MNRDNKEHNERDMPNMLYIRRDAIYTEEITPKKKKKKSNWVEAKFSAET